MSHEPIEDRRSGGDRRSIPTSIWDALGGRGVRTWARRACDRGQASYFDRFSATTLAWILLLLVLSTADGLLTLELLEVDCQEVNPVLRRLLTHGSTHFMLGKYLLVAVGLPVLVLVGSHRRIWYLIPLFVSLHVVLISYQLWLLHQLS